MVVAEAEAVTIAYHGSPAIDAILNEGLIAAKAVDGEGGHSCPHIWLAKRPEDAAAFGPVVAVDVRGFGPWPDDGDDDWQACYHGGDIGPERLSRFLDCESETVSCEAQA